MDDKQIIEFGKKFSEAAVGADNALQAGADLLSAAFPTQPTGPEGRKALSDVKEAARIEYHKRRQAKEKLAADKVTDEHRQTWTAALDMFWSRCLKRAGLRPVKADGTVSQPKAKTGAQTPAGDASKAADKPADAGKVIDAQAVVGGKAFAEHVAALFGAAEADAEMVDCVAVAVAHPFAFRLWAKTVAQATAKEAKQA